MDMAPSQSKDASEISFKSKEALKKEKQREQTRLRMRNMRERRAEECKEKDKNREKETRQSHGEEIRKKEAEQKQQKRKSEIERTKLAEMSKQKRSSGDGDEIRKQEAKRKREKRASADGDDMRAKEAKRKHEKRASSDGDEVRAKEAKRKHEKRASADGDEMRAKEAKRKHDKRASDGDGMRKTARKNDREKERKRKEKLNLASFNDTDVKDNTSFRNFESNPEQSILLYLLNSGSARFKGLDELEKLDPDSIEYQAKVEELVKEVNDEVPTDEELHNLAKEYLLKQGRGASAYTGLNHQLHREEGFNVPTCDSYIITCGACGFRDAERGRTSALAKLSCWSITI